MLQEEKGRKIICKQRHIWSNLQRTIYCKYIKPKYGSETFIGDYSAPSHTVNSEENMKNLKDT